MANHGNGDQYKVEGYGRDFDSKYGGPYLDESELDPKVQYAHAGDPKGQAKFQKDLEALAEAKKPAKKAASKDK